MPGSVGSVVAAVVAGGLLSGTDTDPLGDAGTWSFTLTVVAGTITQTDPVSESTPAGVAGAARTLV